MRWRRWLAAVLLASIVVPLGLSLSRTPAVAANPPPVAADVRLARRIYERVVLARQLPQPRRIRVTWAELAIVAAMSGRAAGLDRVSLDQDGNRAHLQMSRPLPLGFWLNIHAFVEADAAGQPLIRARAGRLPLPAFVAHGAISMGRQLLRMRGATVLPLDQMVRKLQVDNRGMNAVVNLPANSRVLRTLGGLRADLVDSERVSVHYCRLAGIKQAEPVLLAGLVNSAFAAGDGSAGDNRSIFVALALLVAQMDAGALPDGEAALFRKCGKPQTQFLLQGRGDLAKHWTVSAAITAYMGADASLTLGTWKEISDSGAGGSGFSLVDLAADRSGAFSAQRGTDEMRAGAMQDWLARATDDNLLPVSALALAEGMTEGEFSARFTDTDSIDYTAAVARIDSALEVLMQ
jgi:uncharacterized protein YfiM (DUF2279 family)